MPNREISLRVAKDVLQGGEDRATPGVFEDILGFGTATTSIKNVHIMNDLVQTVVGGAPEEGGDLLCRVIRSEMIDDKLDNSDAALRADQRFGAAFTRAFPPELGTVHVRQLRRGARALLNVDGGMYLPATQMASSVATNVALLGADGFRRLRLGAYLAAILDEQARRRLSALYQSDTDPVSRALRPLFQEGPLVGKSSLKAKRTPLSAFDKELGTLLGELTKQPLSKPLLLRYLALGACLSLLLKIYGAGREGGRPALLALAAEQDHGPGPLRERAVLALHRGVSEFDRVLAARLASSPAAKDLWKAPLKKDATITVTDGDREDAAAELVAKLQVARDEDGKSIYWPQKFALSLGRRAGFLFPKDDRAGWGTYLALSPEAVELMVLMLVPAGTHRPWRDFWAEVRERLGVVVGANQPEDSALLESAGVPNTSLQELSENADLLLRQSVSRGVARLLPDSGAEVGVYE